MREGKSFNIEYSIEYSTQDDDCQVKKKAGERKRLL